MSQLLAGDIGGTKTHLALYKEEKGQFYQERDEIFKSSEHKGLEEIVSTFVKGDKIYKAAFGIAGPIENGRCHATNLPWVIDAEVISGVLGHIKVGLINDLLANAYGIKTLGDEDLSTLNKGKEMKGNRALVSAGTGLGEAGFYFDGKEHLPFPSEGGHGDFAPRNEREIELLRFIMKKFGHASYERVLSGPGLSNIYEFLTGMTATPKEISQKGSDKSCSSCAEALEMFISIYGAESGNVALKFLSLGGLYLGGGIAPKILPELQSSPTFMDAFVDKGRFKPLLEKIPVKVILNAEAALRGAAYYAHHLV